ncbi:hypothetical protein ACFU9X_44425, partial [Streptomyces atratus]|uniref:hypothetical protein n=1 Tax=Streptomyces atratus TaxID=1893 RepID=UPI0036B8BB14
MLQEFCCCENGEGNLSFVKHGRQARPQLLQVGDGSPYDSLLDVVLHSGSALSQVLQGLVH